MKNRLTLVLSLPDNDRNQLRVMMPYSNSISNVKESRVLFLIYIIIIRRRTITRESGFCSLELLGKTDTHSH